MKKTSKLLSLLLALVMVLGMLPTMALAAGEGCTGNGTEADPYVVTTYEALKAAFDDAINQNKVFVKLGADIQEESIDNKGNLSLERYYHVNFDLNGHTLDVAARTTYRGLFDFSNFATLRIYDSSAEKTGTVKFSQVYGSKHYSGIFNMEGADKTCKLTIDGGNFYSKNNVIASTTGYGSVVINGGYLEAGDSSLAMSTNSVIQVNDYSDCDFTINGGTFYAVTDAIIRTQYGYGDFTINGGTFIGNTANNAIFEFLLSNSSGLVSNAKVVFNGGEIQVSDSYKMYLDSSLSNQPGDITVRNIRLVSDKTEIRENYFDSRMAEGALRYLSSDRKTLVVFTPEITDIRIADIAYAPEGEPCEVLCPEGTSVQVKANVFESLPKWATDAGYSAKIKLLGTAVGTPVEQDYSGGVTTSITPVDGKNLYFELTLYKNNAPVSTWTSRIFEINAKKTPISSVALTMSDDELTIGKKLKNYSFSTTTTGVDNAKTRIWLWYCDDSVVSEESLIGTGRYSAMLNFYSENGYQFTSDTKFTFGGTDYSATAISNDGNFAAVKVNVGELVCTHNFGSTYTCESGTSEDAYSHWQICSVCGAASAKEKHTYDYANPTLDSDTATYTCTAAGCGHQYSIEIPSGTTIKTVITNEELFAVGNTIPTDPSDFPVVGKPGYSVTGVEWKKSDGSEAGTTFESGVEYFLTLTVETTSQYTIETSASGTPTGITIANYSKSASLSAGGVANVNWDATGLFINTSGHTYKITIKGTPYIKPNVTITMPESLVGMSYLDAIKAIDYGEAHLRGNGTKYYMVTIYDGEDDVYTAAKINNSDWQSNDTNSPLVSGKTYRFKIQYSWGGQTSGGNTYYVRYGWTADNITIVNAISGSKVVEPIAFSVDAICTVGSNKINNVAITGIEAPAPGKTPDTTASVPNNANYTVKEVEWEGNPAAFAANNAYTVNVTLEAKAGYLFDESIVASVNGVAATTAIPSQDKKTCTVTYTFPKTVLSISIVDATLNGTVGTVFSKTLTATPNTDITWMKNGGVLPNGLSLNSDGTLSGIPTVGGEFKFFVTAMHTSGEYASKELTMTVSAAPVVGTMSLPDGKVGKPYSETLSANGYPTDMTWAIASGDLPAGLTLNPTTGEISGTPTTAETKTFTVTAENTVGTSTPTELTITITADTQPEPTKYSVIINGGNASTTGAGDYAEGEIVTIFAGTRSGYSFDGWTSDDVTITSANSKTASFTMPDKAVIVTANWSKNSGGGGYNPPTHDYYTLTFDTNGGSYIAPITKIEGTNVSLASYKPTKAGFDFTGWYADAALNNKVTSITLNSNKTVYAVWTVPNPLTGGFDDVPEDAYYADAVEWAVENGVTSGTSDTTFSPNAACTRAQAVTFLWRANGCPEPQTANNPFADVSADAYYYKAVLWAVEQGITVGTSATTFSPNDTCTRAQIVTFLYRAAGEPATTGTLFDDVAASAYYAEAVKWAVAEGITVGTSDTTFSPDANCTRAQIVTFIFRQINK